MCESLLSVGLDVGTTSTQMVVSRLKVENRASIFAVPELAITQREILYESPVYFTPLLDESHVNREKIREIVEEEYRKAGISRAQVDTGAIIITGETSRKENARAVLDALSDLAGEFVVATAGPDLESVLAAKGAGAVAYSEETGKTVANFDIGGGTTNICLFRDGAAIDTTCLDIGGRLIKVDESGRVTYIAQKLKKLADMSGISVSIGDILTPETAENICREMTEVIEQSAGLRKTDSRLELMITNHGKKSGIVPDIITFSGGVADLLDPDADGRELFRYGDIGALLGRSLCRSPLFARVPRLSASETIAATVIGAGTHTTTLSGSTVSVNAAVLPQKNLPVLRLTAEQEAACLRGETDALSDAVSWFLQQHDTQRFVLALEGPEDPDYPSLCRLASALCCCLDTALPEGAPVFLVLARDVGKALGLAVRGCLRGRRASVVLDGLRPENGGYLDLGKPLMDGLTVPVIIKTLIFG